jgi:hypothetical protein
MLAEHPTSTTERFIPSWRSVDPKRLEEEILSVSNETNRRLDHFYFIVKDGELIDPATNSVINFESKTELEHREVKVWNSLKDWANTIEEGSAVWKSPRFPGIYPCDKAVYYEIAYTFEFPSQKVLRSTAILLDAPSQFEEHLRDKLFIKDPKFTLTDLLEELGQKDNKNSQTPSQKEINYFVEKIKRGDSAKSIVKEMQEQGIIGSYSISCPTRSSVALSRNSQILNFSREDQYGSLDFECPSCKKTNTREPGKLLSHCQHCGCDVRCG